MPTRKHPLLIMLALAVLLQAWVGLRLGHAQQGLAHTTKTAATPCHGLSQEMPDGASQAGATDAAAQRSAHPAGAPTGPVPDGGMGMADCDHFSCCLALASWASPSGLAHSRPPTDQPVHPEHGLHGQHPLPELRPPI